MKLLIADDERDIADAVGIIMKFHGYDNDVVYNGLDAYELARKNVYDGIILDIMMPKMDGISIIKRLRSEGDTTPILLLTAKSEVDDKIEGLNIGADDYLAKPFDKGELAARINVMMRRQNQYLVRNITMGNTQLNMDKMEIANIDNSLRLSSKEVEILGVLMSNSNKSIHERTLIEKIWGSDEYTDGTIKLYMGYLKNKLEAIHSNLIICYEEECYQLMEQ